MPLIEDTSKYEWSACWKSNSALPVLATFTLQSSDVPVTDTVYATLNGASHIASVYSDGSSASVAELSVDETSFQSTLRAKPCCCTPRLHASWSSSGPNCGKQWLRPPEIGFEPSHLASGRFAIHSVPLASLYDVTSPPKR